MTGGAGGIGAPGVVPTLDDVNRCIGYHSGVAAAMTRERTALESALIPVTAYILVSGVECYRRYPDLIRAITAVATPEELGAAGRRPGSQVDAVHLWSIANIPLVGRQVMAPFGMLDPGTDLDTMATILDFWSRAAAAFRSDGHLQAWDAGSTVPRYPPPILDELVAGTAPLDDAGRASLGRLSGTLAAFLFLLYFDTRSGYQDTGPYPLPDGRTLMVRDFNRFGPGHFAWSRGVCDDLAHSDLALAFVLDGVTVTVDDWGTSRTDPTDYLGRTVAAGVFDTSGGSLRPVDPATWGPFTAAVKDAQRSLYRRIAAMERREKIDAGAYVYFTFLRPFAEEAGIAEDLDWSVPRDSGDLYDVLSGIDSVPEVSTDDPLPYYWPVGAAGEPPDAAPAPDPEPAEDS